MLEACFKCSLSKNNMKKQLKIAKEWYEEKRDNKENEQTRSLQQLLDDAENNLAESDTRTMFCILGLWFESIT